MQVLKDKNAIVRVWKQLIRKAEEFVQSEKDPFLTIVEQRLMWASKTRSDDMATYQNAEGNSMQSLQEPPEEEAYTDAIRQCSTIDALATEDNASSIDQPVVDIPLNCQQEVVAGSYDDFSSSASLSSNKYRSVLHVSDWSLDSPRQSVIGIKRDTSDDLDVYVVNKYRSVLSTPEWRTTNPQWEQERNRKVVSDPEVPRKMKSVSEPKELYNTANFQTREFQTKRYQKASRQSRPLKGLKILLHQLPWTRIFSTNASSTPSLSQTVGDNSLAPSQMVRVGKRKREQPRWTVDDIRLVKQSRLVSFWGTIEGIIGE